jgi:2-methylisocitrate lyase-like PEP mutase family enzyme
MASTISTAAKTKTFRELHARERGFIIPNPWDAGSARLLEGLGFEALATTSAGAAFSMGQADGALTREAVLDNARAIAAAVNVPVNADLLNCFGDAPETVAETIRLAGDAGLAGGSVEDTTGDPSRPLYEINHAVERVQAAVEAARALPQPFVLTARCDGLLAKGCTVEEAFRRILAYQAAGADVLYVPSLVNLDQVRDLLQAVERPVNVLAGPGQLRDANALLDLGVKRVSVGSSLYAATMGAFMRAAEMLKQGSMSYTEGALPYAELQKRFSKPAGES